MSNNSSNARVTRQTADFEAEEGEEINWHHIASTIPDRNNKDCRKRWIYILMPSLNKGPWSDQEDALLREGARLHGFKSVPTSSEFTTLFMGEIR